MGYYWCSGVQYSSQIGRIDDMRNIVYTVMVIIGLACLASCKNHHKPPVDLSKVNVIEVPFTEDGGVKYIPVKLNGVGMNMIFDTGCSGLSISSLELVSMLKSGSISESDFMGTQESQIADGTVVVQQVVNIAEVEIGGNGGILCQNVEATVSDNMEAPVLLGNGVLDNVNSIEVDNVHKVIRFKLK